MRTPQFLLALLIAYLGTGEEIPAVQTGRDANPVRVYRVNRTVADFPDIEDLSTPEAAYAAINRISAAGERGAWRRLSVKAIRHRLAPGDAENVKVKPEKARQFLQVRILEVRVFQEMYAAVIAELAVSGKPARYDIRHLEHEGGRWLNSGNDRRRSLDEARTLFARVCGRHAEKPVRPGVSNPEAHLKSFVEFLKAKGADPKPFVMDALADHRLVIMGEIHHRPHYWAFNASLVRDPKFADHVGTIYLELPYNDQDQIDGFLIARELGIAPVVEMLRDMFWMGWPDRAMLDFFVVVWKVNQGLPPEKRLRIVLVDMQRPWGLITQRGDWANYDTDRDHLMAVNIQRDLLTRTNERRNGLFIVGIGHAQLDLHYFDGTTPVKSAAWYLRQALGPDNVYVLMPHSPRMTNHGKVYGRLCLGLFDKAFAALDNRHVAFLLTEGPFGRQPFDALPDLPAQGTYGDAYSAYLYLGPLEDETPSPLIPGFYAAPFLREMDRRCRLMFRKGLVEAGVVPELSTEGFVAHMGTYYGQPRRWREYLGPIDAWHDGDGWEEKSREEYHNNARKHPEMIADAARNLIEMIRMADYDAPRNLWNLFEIHYDVYRGYDSWTEWICKTFKENPISVVDIGPPLKDVPDAPNIPEKYAGYPTVSYKLTLKDGTVLQSNLPFEYRPRSQTWQGWCGLDWHLLNSDRTSE